MLKGNLSGFSLGEIFQSLAINKHTGTLTLTTRGVAKHIYFLDGNIRFFSHGSPKTPRIGEILVRSGCLKPTDLEEALREAKASEKLLGRVLLDNGYISEDDIQSALTQKISEELYELFALEEGDFEFDQDRCPGEVFDAVQQSVKVTIQTNSVIMEGLRRIDEWQMIHSTIKTENEIYVATGEDLPANCEPGTQRILEEHVNGLSSVREIVEAGSGPKFGLLKSIYDMLSAGTIRPLTAVELQAQAIAARKDKEFPRAATCLRFAAELDPDNARIRLDLGESLAKFYQDEEAESAYVSALQIYYEQGDWDNAASVAEKLPPNADLDPHSLQMLLHTFIELKLVKRALWAGQQLATILQKQGDTSAAAEVLDSLTEVDPDDLNLRVQIATLFQQVGETTRATEYYEEVADILESQKKIKDLIKILRQILDLNPKRSELKLRISTLSALLEKMERQRKRRMTLMGASAIGLLILSVVPVLYEIKARELFIHGIRMEEISINTGDFSGARSIFEQLLEKYSLSSKVHESTLALERISYEERSIEDSTRVQVTIRKQEVDERRRKTDAKIDKIFALAKAAENEWKFEEAHRYIKEALEIDSSSLKKRGMAYPLGIRTNPAKAKLVVNGKLIGTTPHILYYEPGDAIEISLTRRGCEEIEDTITLRNQHELSYELQRRPVAEVLLPSDFDQPAENVGRKSIFAFPSRDGYIYAYDPDEKDIIWRKKIGRFGDRMSNLHVRNGYIYVGTVDNKLLAFHARSGKKKWPVRRVRGPILAAPTTSRDENWVAVANLYGEVYILDNRTGQVVDKFSTENEIVAAPVFAGNYLLVGSRDNYVYAYNVRDRRVEFLIELQGSPDIDPVRFAGEAIFATSEGRVYRIDTAHQRTAWSVKVTEKGIASILANDEAVFVALVTGRVLSLNPKTGEVRENWPVTNSVPGGMRLQGDILYVGHENGLVVAWDVKKGKLSWSWQADASISSAPLILNKRLYVTCNSGTVQVLELLD